MNNEQIPESVINEWKDEAEKKFNMLWANLSASIKHGYIEGCKSQYPFRQKYEKLHKVLEKADDELNTLLAFGDESAQQFAIKLKSIIHQAL